MSTIRLNPGTDKLTDTQKVTSGYFTGGSGQLNAADIYTGSLSSTNEEYYFNITQTHPLSSSATTQFSVAYGHVGGSGSKIESGTKGETEAVYKQWAVNLLSENEVSGGFIIDGSTRDDDIYVLVGKRSLFKDRINKGNWTIALSGSGGPGFVGDGAYSGSKILHLTDDSKTTVATHTVAGPRYNIYSGSDGTVTNTTHKYGWIYPELGTMIFSGNKLALQISGVGIGTGSAAQFDSGSYMGFEPYAGTALDGQNALRFVNCLQPGGAYLKFRSEEDQNSTSYFCRVFANQMNFSNNPTFVSGSYNELKHTSMWGNPTVYISSIGLYDDSGNLVAIGKLSTALKKNFSSEATIKVKLTY